MTGDRRDRTATDDAGTGSWVDGLRDLEGTSRATGLRDRATRRTAVDGRSAGQTGAPEPDPATLGSPSLSRLVTAVRRVAAVDRLRPVGTPEKRRYGQAVDARVLLDGSLYDLELRRYESPDETGFAGAVADQFDRWVAESDCAGMVPALDAGGTAHPWTLTAPVDATLADRSLDPPAALRQARALGQAVAALHDRGIVHAGIDPRHVVYPAGSDRPALDNAGLADVYRRYADPAAVLDPRYAPPEYFDDRYGVVDRATDVYALGAVCYRLLTGRPPYDGSPAEVREAVFTDPVPRPSAEAPVPAAVDTVVRTATATDKFDRYASAEAFCSALRTACDDD